MSRHLAGTPQKYGESLPHWVRYTVRARCIRHTWWQSANGEPCAHREHLSTHPKMNENHLQALESTAGVSSKASKPTWDSATAELSSSGFARVQSRIANKPAPDSKQITCLCPWKYTTYKIMCKGSRKGELVLRGTGEKTIRRPPHPSHCHTRLRMKRECL